MNEALEAKAILTDGKVIYRKDILTKGIITGVTTEFDTYQVDNGNQSTTKPSSRAKTIITLEITNSYHDDLRDLQNTLHNEVLLIRRNI